MAYPRHLRSLAVILTPACNLRCAYCYQNRRQGGTMSWLTLEAAVARLLASSRRRVWLTFTGGEPLLEFGLLRRAVRYVQARKRSGQDIRYHLLTNGILLGARETEFLARVGFHLQLSLDGVAPVQAVRGKETFQVLDDLLSRLARDEPTWFADRVGVAVAVLPRTLPLLPESIEYLLSKGIQDIALAPTLTCQSDWHDRDVDALEDRIARVFQLSVDHFRRTGRVPVRLFRRSPAPLSEPTSALCGAGRSDCLTVDVDGDVSGCALFAHSYQRFPETPLGRAAARFTAGRIDQAHLAAALAECRRRIAASGLFTNRLSKYSSYGRCATCRHRRRCSFCPISIVHQPGNADPNRVPDFVCAFQRAVAKHSSAFHAASV